MRAWYHQATSHYLSQCWPSFMSPYGITRPQLLLNFIWPLWLHFEIWEITFIKWNQRYIYICIHISPLCGLGIMMLSMVQAMACRSFSAKLSPVLTYCEESWVLLVITTKKVFSSMRIILKITYQFYKNLLVLPSDTWVHRKVGHFHA